MTRVQDVCDYLEIFAPTALAEDWDNVGLIVGDPAGELSKIMTCLTVTPDSASEAIEKNAGLIISHHPLPFRPLNRITTETVPSSLLWNLIRAGVSIYSPHTGFDSADRGINQLLGERLGLTGLEPLIPGEEPSIGPGAGRHGRLDAAVTLSEFSTTVKTGLGLDKLKIVGSPEAAVSHVAIACGSGGSFLEKAIAAGCDCFVTGEATFHTCLEAQARNISLVLTGHYASERFAVETLAETLAAEFSKCEVWASEKESDPVQIV